MSKTEWLDWNGVLYRETDAAILLKSSTDELWIPKSQVSTICYHDGDSEEIHVEEEIEAVLVSSWWLREKGLI